MRPEFRFPRSTVVLMLLILCGIVLVLLKANSIQLKHAMGADLSLVWPVLPWALAIMVVVACATVAVVWGTLYSLHRTGMDRLENLQPWLEQK